MKEYKYFIERTYKPASDVVVLELAEKNGNPVFGFKPGQYVMISYKNEKGKIEDKHAFSIASAPSDKDYIRLGIKISGNFTQGISKLREGEEIFVSGPFGDFVFDEKKHQEAVFLAGGIGITPFISALRQAAQNNLPNKLSLIYSNRNIAGTIFLDELKELAKNNKNIRTLFSITEEKIPRGAEGFVNERVNRKIISDYIGSVSGKTFFLCGPEKFMFSMKENLISLGVKKEQIMAEEFTMIADSGFRPMAKSISYAVGFSVAAMLLPFYLIYGASKGNSVVSINKEDINNLPHSSDIYNAAVKLMPSLNANNFDSYAKQGRADINSAQDKKNPAATTINNSKATKTTSNIKATKMSSEAASVGKLIVNNNILPQAINSAPAPVTSVSAPLTTASVQASSQSASASCDRRRQRHRAPPLWFLAIPWPTESLLVLSGRHRQPCQQKQHSLARARVVPMSGRTVDQGQLDLRPSLRA